MWTDSRFEYAVGLHFHFVFHSQTVEGGGVPLIFQILIDILTWQNLNGAFRLFNWPTNFNNIRICVLFTHKDTFPDAYFQLFVQHSIPLKTHQGL